MKSLNNKYSMIQYYFFDNIFNLILLGMVPIGTQKNTVSEWLMEALEASYWLIFLTFELNLPATSNASNKVTKDVHRIID